MTMRSIQGRKRRANRRLIEVGARLSNLLKMMRMATLPVVVSSVGISVGSQRVVIAWVMAVSCPMRMPS